VYGFRLIQRKTPAALKNRSGALSWASESLPSGNARSRNLTPHNACIAAAICHNQQGAVNVQQSRAGHTLPSTTDLTLAEPAKPCRCFSIKWQFYPLLQKLAVPARRAGAKALLASWNSSIAALTLFNLFHALPRRYRAWRNNGPGLTGKFQKWHYESKGLAAAH